MDDDLDSDFTHSMSEIVHRLQLQSAPAPHAPDVDFERMVIVAFYDDDDEYKSACERAALISIVLHTRDIVDGWGEYALFCELVVRFDQVIDAKEPFVSRQKTETMRVILHKVLASCVGPNGYGSWKDLKYLLNHLRDVHGERAAARKPMFKYVVALACEQLSVDAAAVAAAPAGPAPTLAGKWVPREKSNKFGWQAKYFAMYCHPEWCGGTLDVQQVPPRALRKCLTHYRKTIASINRGLYTPQINQCSREWASIDFETNVSRTTMDLQELAFKYAAHDGTLREPNGSDYTDRMRCRARYIANERHTRHNRRNRESYHNPLSPKHMNNILYHPRYEWVWNDPLIMRSH